MLLINSGLRENAMMRWAMVLTAVLASAPALTRGEETLHIQPGQSIQAAIDAAGAGDEIIVHPGTYAERIDFHGKALTLRSAGGPAVTTLDGELGGVVVTCDQGEGSDTILAGFTITGGDAETGGGMRLYQTSPSIEDCVFLDNEAEYGAAIFIQGGSPSLVRCAFTQNTASASGGAVYHYGSPVGPGATLIDCDFDDNSAEGDAGALRVWDANPTLTGCRFIANHARYRGAAVANGGLSQTTFANCRFESNLVNTLFAAWDCYGGAVSSHETSRATLVNCLFTGNRGQATPPWLSHGGAVATGDEAETVLINCTLTGNYANIGHGLYNDGATDLTVTNSVLWDGFDELVSEAGASVTITYSAVTGGWPGLGNTADDPLLGDESRLQPGSPCIDTADPAYAPAGGTDLDGHARVLCGRVDMGAFESGIGDHDCSQNVNLTDFAAWGACLTGPGGGPYAGGCEALDFEYDGDVDLVDFAGFQSVFAE